ncbi:hypothetical protein V6N12_004080 [Hibiscus sabdariffa]|uniref:Uncharacterized protein n=1 Tax=Hibiscus sabdariffa TaxID=183260 RepID=A0ABR2CKP7_9ROSI
MLTILIACVVGDKVNATVDVSSRSRVIPVVHGLHESGRPMHEVDSPHVTELMDQQAMESSVDGLDSPSSHDEIQEQNEDSTALNTSPMNDPATASMNDPATTPGQQEGSDMPNGTYSMIEPRQVESAYALREIEPAATASSSPQVPDHTVARDQHEVSEQQEVVTDRNNTIRSTDNVHPMYVTHTRPDISFAVSKTGGEMLMTEDLSQATVFSVKPGLFIVVVLLFATAGTLIMAQPQPQSQAGGGRVCAVPFVISNCSNNVCNRECANKFPPNGTGLCQGELPSLNFQQFLFKHVASVFIYRRYLSSS